MRCDNTNTARTENELMQTPTEISRQLGTWLTRVEQNKSIPAATRLDMGLFLDRVVELVEQSFREVLRLSIKLQFMPDTDLSRDRIQEYRRRAEQLRARDRYRDVDFICGRLHVLRAEFEAYREFTESFGDDFQQLMWLVDEREGAIINLVQGFVYEVIHRLDQMMKARNQDDAKILRDEMRNFVVDRIGELELAIKDLVDIHNRILPLLGESEFLKVIAGTARPAQSVKVIDKRVQTGGGDYAAGNIQKAGRDIVRQTAGRDFAARDLTSNSGEAPGDLDQARRVLQEAVLNFPQERRATIQKQIDKVIDGITAKSSPSALQEKAKHLEMFLESGKDLFSDTAKAAWAYVKGKLPGGNSGAAGD